MEFAFIISTVLLLLFAILALYDGFYLHIFKYRLYEHNESKFEHLMHTYRAVLFPLIVYCLCLGHSFSVFLLGILFVIFDIVVLGVDAFVEKDSRVFMGGLPRWEYIVHLFVNGFHFALISALLIIKLQYADGEFIFINQFENVKSYSIFILIVKNILPGAIILALLHIMVSFKSTVLSWNKFRNKVTCC